MRWTVVIPVKGAPAAKSRLGPAVDDDARAVLARAFALDTIAAAVATPSVSRVLVVGVDPEVARVAGAEFVREGGAAPAAGVGPRGLLAAVRQGADAARAEAPVAVAVLLGDLPGLHPEELDRALEAAARHPLAFVRDADGTGSTLATASDGVAFEPRFGPDSAARHVAAGFVELAASDLPGLTRDVDTVDGLEIVLHHGVGDHTAEAVARLADRKGTA
ncbi:2-phospho-L-lactate guanylyltransferase [Agromyces sp. 3263]|uniref:2-phospho-L-lactate guanylyltransferase n=1 Tax=Agromyces sp. 3263 TaxID=2817750 RepID=UPI002859C165|nr:2-phospho-L-lactate guanylyltransferase [Agromyces sp. 3263]MDR6906047.1 2-phospho-L-lactate guanylyltransferase [Agromyces sp. 3263]